MSLCVSNIPGVREVYDSNGGTAKSPADDFLMDREAGENNNAARSYPQRGLPMACFFQPLAETQKALAEFWLCRLYPIGDAL